MGDVFTLAGYVVSVGGFVSSVVLVHHYRHCKCWKSVKEVVPADDESDSMMMTHLDGASS